MQPTNSFRLFRSFWHRVIIRGVHGSRIVLAASTIAATMVIAHSVWAQFPASDSNNKKPVLRSVAVVEWTGPLGKPKASRLIPVAVFADGQYMDGGLYLAQPAPLALLSGTEYVLEKSGLPQGYYDLSTAGKNDGAWFGYGAWKPIPPVVHTLQASTSTHQVGVVDNDQPHFGYDARKAAGSTSNAGTQSQSASAPPVDPDRPTLRQRPAKSSTAQNVPAVTAMPTAAGPIDPDRPHLSYGKPAEQEHTDLTQLKIGAQHLQQMAAVSDAVEREPHPYAYSWNSPDQQTAMQQKLQAMALKILDQTPLSQPTSTARKSTASARQAGRRTHTSPASVPELTNVVFKAFALTYENNPTFVYSAEATAPDTTDAGGNTTPIKRYITLIVQPDIYDDPHLVMQSVTDDQHLDAHPRMKLVDAIDANADNRAELLFELDGQSQRQFALYLVTQGAARQLFVTGPLPM